MSDGRSNEKIRIAAVFYGQVQGVGFRYTASYTAKSLGLAGWVRNEYDGSVSSEIQGDRRSIEEFIRRIQGGRFIDITHTECREIPVDPDDRSFKVKY
ncbi:MAG: acylphosphatase [Lachnospiraceae bacterium]|nr:acylphosphatase [Lachnospiraceae bacterium]